jgi:Flp pilus assembly protein TadG
MLTTGSRRPRRGDQGSALMLVPAGVLVMLILAAIAVDLSAVHLAQRGLLDAAADAANDAAGAAINESSLRTSGSYRVDVDRARRIATESVLAQRIPHLDFAASRVEVDPATGTVTVVLVRSVDRIFARAIPGAADTVQLTARAQAFPVVR